MNARSPFGSPQMLVLYLCVCIPPSATAQQSSHPPNPPVPHGTGRVYVNVAPSGSASSLQELCKKSALIVNATVIQVFPAREMGGSHQGSLETDFELVIDAVLKGSADIADVVVSQVGGTTAQYGLKPAQYSMLQQGEQAILFLTQDNRPIPSPVPAAARYTITGSWSGLFEFSAGKMVTQTDPARQPFAGQTMSQVTEAIQAALKAN